MSYIFAMSVKEPWISMIVDGEKTIETRTWPAPTLLYSHSLLLVGSKKPAGRYSGQAACWVKVADCHPMIKADEEAACCAVYPTAFSWVLEDVTPVKPIPIKGRLGIYRLEDIALEIL